MKINDRIDHIRQRLRRVTPIEIEAKNRIDHIRQCLRRMVPIEIEAVAAADEIEKELAELERVVTAPRNCPVCLSSLEAMIRNSPSGDTCG